jgi:hypothetical protein
MSAGTGVARVSEAVSEALLALLVPVALMIAALAMQRLEHHLLGPSPSTEDDAVPRRAPVTRAVPPARPAR